MIRRVIPGTIASELVGVQPMSAPSSLADVFNMKLSFGINRVTVKNSDGVTFILIFSEDAGKERDDPRLLGAEVFFLCQGEEVLIFKETFVLPDDINGFSVISSASSEFEERIDEITIGADISHPRMMALVNRAIDTEKSLPADPATTLALAVAKSYSK